MAFVAAFLIFAALSAATWYVSLACLKSTFPDAPAPTTRRGVSALAIGSVTLTCFVPFPAGYVAGVIVWAVAAFGFLDLPAGRASVLAGYLAVGSVVTRLVVLGVLAAL